jgi:opine dehydrogenase
MGKKIAIVGAGNLGQAMAAHMALEGHEVKIYNRTTARIEEIRERGGIEIDGAVNGFAKLAHASDDMGEVIPGAELIVVTVPASSHRAISLGAAEHLEDGQAVVLHPGHTFGAFDFAAGVKEAGFERDLTYGEIQTSLLTSRLVGPAKVHVSAIKNALPISVFPSDHGFEKIEVLFELYPSSIRAPDVLKTSLDNLNAPVHVPVTLLNLGIIDRGVEFLYYWEGYTPAISKLVEAVDAERCELARALGVVPITIQEFFSTAYDTKGVETWEKVRSNQAYKAITGPKSTDTRLIWEDFPTGIVPFSSLGAELGIPTPTCDALITIGNAIFEKDFREGARTMESMGLSGLGPEGIQRFARTGER